MFVEDLPKLRKLQKVLSEEPFQPIESYKYRSIRFCKTPSGFTSGVIVAKGLKDMKIQGLSHCGNAWVCPVCSAAAANKQSSLITAAIQVLKIQNLVPVMLTLTIPNCRAVKLPTLLDCLKKSWTFLKNSKSNKYSNDAFAKFYRNFNIKHTIKTCEVTYSFLNGWHPHFHILFFINPKQIPLIKTIEDDLAAKWRLTIKNYMAKALKNFPEALEQFNITAEKSTQPGLFFSKNSNGDIRIADVASYIAGWSCSSEIAAGSNSKTGSIFNGTKHYSVSEIVTFATSNNPNAEKFKLLLKELLAAVHKKVPRWAWSHTGLKKLAENFINETGEISFKKKFMALEILPKYTVVAYIPSELAKKIFYDGFWYEIENHLLNLFNENQLFFENIADIFRKYKYPIPFKDFFGKIKSPTLQNAVA